MIVGEKSGNAPVVLARALGPDRAPILALHAAAGGAGPGAMAACARGKGATL